jgi:hypothetical protein
MLAPHQPPNWRTTPCQLSTTAYSLHSHLPSMRWEVNAVKF